MARDHGRVQFGLWNDDDLMKRSRSAILMYVSLFSQPTMSWTGVLPLMVSRWAEFGGGSDYTEDDVRDDLEELEQEGFIAVDWRTHEVLVRSFIRNDGVTKQPNVLQGALKQAPLVQSDYLRHVLADELRRLTMPASSRNNPKYLDPAAVADDIDPGDTPPPPNPSRTLRDGFETPSRTPHEPPANPSHEENAKPQVNGVQHENTPNPSRTLREPPGEGDGETSPQRSHLGKWVAADARARARGTTDLAELSQNAVKPAARRIVDDWRAELDPDGNYRKQKIRELTKVADELLAEGCEAGLVRQALDEFHRRSDARQASSLRWLYDDAVKAAAGARNGGRPTREDKVNAWLNFDPDAPDAQQPYSAREDKVNAWLNFDYDAACAADDGPSLTAIEGGKSA